MILEIIIFLVILLLIYYIINFTCFQKVIYFDNNASAPPYKEVVDAMYFGSTLGNPSCFYNEVARDLLKTAKKEILEWVQVPDYCIIFTSGASESNNLFIRGIVDNHWRYKKYIPHIIASSVEHASILKCLYQLKYLNRIEYNLIPVNEYGELKKWRHLIQPNTILITVMHVNNEIGNIYDIQKIAQIAKKHNIIFHSDIVQSFGKFSVPLRNISAASVSFHKIHGPTGIGALIFSRNINLEPQICGSQNEGIRGGTENVPGISGSLAALRIIRQNRDKKNDHLRSLTHIIRLKLSNYNIIFLGKNQAPGILSISFPGLCGRQIKEKLYQKKIVVSQGSACGSSHVLKEMGLSPEIQKGVLRISLGDQNTLDECERFCEELIKIIKI